MSRPKAAVAPVPVSSTEASTEKSTFDWQMPWPEQSFSQTVRWQAAPVYPGKHINPDGGADYYTPPGQWGNTVARGRVGKKYQAWDGQSKSAEPAEIRNYYDNRKTLDIP